MNKVSVFMMAGLVFLSTSGVAALRFSDAVPEVNPGQMDYYNAENDALQKALELNNAMNQMWEAKSRLEEQARSQKHLKVQQKRMEAMENCNVRRLSEQFKNPKQVWEKMKSEYDRREKDLTIYINSAEGMTDEERETVRAEIEAGTFSDERLGEMMAYWSIGNDILTDVYQNQDAWGERKGPKSPSFPLWDDQKHLFDKKWDGTYVQLNTYFGVPPQGRPLIGDEKYDYARYDDVETAHKTYVAALAAKNPVKAAGLAASLKQAPAAPKPLPPKEESIIYLESDDPARQVYPAMPEPWKQYQDGNFKDVAPKGEMAEDFSKGLVLKESAKNLTSTQRNNRLAVYQLLKKELNGAQKAADLVNQNTQRSVRAATEQIGQYIALDDDFNLADAKKFEEALELLKKQKEDLLTRAEEKIKNEEALYREAFGQTAEKKRLESVDTMVAARVDNPAYQQDIQKNLNLSVERQDKATLAALRKDVNGELFLNETNAPDIDRMLRELEAAKALEKSRKEWDKEIEKMDKQPIDNLCINGGSFEG